MSCECCYVVDLDYVFWFVEVFVMVIFVVSMMFLTVLLSVRVFHKSLVSVYRPSKSLRFHSCTAVIHFYFLTIYSNKIHSCGFSH